MSTVVEEGDYIRYVKKPEEEEVSVDTTLLEDHEREAISTTANGKFRSSRGILSNVFEETKICKINPLRCISIRKLRCRPLCCWGIRMMENTIICHSDANSCIQGFASTGRFAVVANIPEEFNHLVIEHFLPQRKSEVIAVSLASSGSWYHVCDGGHLHGGIVEAVENFSEIFGGFTWPVVVIPWQHEDWLLAVSKRCNEMQSDAHMIDFTLLDAMQNIRDIIDTHSRRQGMTLVPGEKVRNGFIKEIIRIYSGSPGYSNNTMRSICGIVLKLSSDAVKGIRLLLTAFKSIKSGTAGNRLRCEFCDKAGHAEDYLNPDNPNKKRKKGSDSTGRGKKVEIAGALVQKATIMPPKHNRTYAGSGATGHFCSTKYWFLF